MEKWLGCQKLDDSKEYLHPTPPYSHIYWADIEDKQLEDCKGILRSDVDTLWFVDESHTLVLIEWENILQLPNGIVNDRAATP